MAKTRFGSLSWLKRAIALCAISLAIPIGSEAQVPTRASPDSLRARLRLPQPATYSVLHRGRQISPSMTIGVASGYGAAYGDAFVGAGFQARTRFADRADGGLVAGFGIGDPRRLVGLELAATSYGTFRSCCRGGISAKVHRLIPGDASVAIGVENAVTWGRMEGEEEEEATDAGRSFYAAASKSFRLRSDPTRFLGSGGLTLGVGNGRYRFESDILDDNSTVNVFGSAGVRIARPASFVVGWTGQDLATGVSIVPFSNIPLFITPAVADLTTSPRFILGIGYGFNYSSLF